MENRKRNKKLSFILQNFIKKHLNTKSNSIKYADWRNMRDRVKGTELQGLFEKYFNSIIYSEDSYLMDEIHWNDAYLEKNKGTLVDKILLKSNEQQASFIESAASQRIHQNLNVRYHKCLFTLYICQKLSQGKYFCRSKKECGFLAKYLLK